MTKLESQADLYSQVIRSEDVWLVAFINAERGAIMHAFAHQLVTIAKLRFYGSSAVWQIHRPFKCSVSQQSD